MNTCDNPHCYCDTKNCSQSTSDITILPITNNLENYDKLTVILDSQRDILNQINTMQIDTHEDVELNTKIKYLKNMLEMVLLKLDFWDYEHKKTLSYSSRLDNDTNTNPQSECELVILDNEIETTTNSNNPNPNIKSEEELEATINCEDVDDGDEADTDIELDLNDNLDMLDINQNIYETEVFNDIDVELESVDLETSIISNSKVENPVEKEHEQYNDAIGDLSNITNFKDLLSMLMMVSMATDSESIIRQESPPLPPSDDLD